MKQYVFIEWDGLHKTTKQFVDVFEAIRFDVYIGNFLNVNS
ncbi:hypothetical protein [Parageobacillus sp. G301]|nr:hypothetical protein [Parageobacillus sp. G301]